PRKTQVLGYGMKDLQTPVSHDDSPDWCADDISSHSVAFPGSLRWSRQKYCCFSRGFPIH
ncbi:MAG: hypothetical protein KGP14_04170, partial [Betaproteobacteria bacterium]|nr:hypothetical protein [Betaproteobacteria bacterium]